MNIFLTNCSNKIVLFSIDNAPFSVLNPLSQTSITLHNIDKTQLSLKHNYESEYVKNKWSTDKYNLVINSEYLFSNLTNREEIKIFGEKTLIAYNAYYDYFSIKKMNSSLISESYTISDKDKIFDTHIKSINQKKIWRFWDLLLSPILNTPLRFVFFILIGIVLSMELGWKFAILYFPILYLILLLACLFGNWLGSIIFKKTTSIEDESISVSQYITNEYITNFFSSSGRTYSSENSKY